MEKLFFYRAGTTDSCISASEILKSSGALFLNHPDRQITDLLLDIPSFDEPGILRSGEKLESLLNVLPQDVRIWGGNLPEGHNYRDLLKDIHFLTENASITADCAIRICAASLKTTWEDTSVLVIGWGRIGKCLSKMLKARNANVTVCARKEPDRALLTALGYHAIPPESLSGKDFRVIFNTAPAPIMDSSMLSGCPLPIDLASRPGLKGENVISARGLPGIYAPETTGKLIADTILSLLGGEKA